MKNYLYMLVAVVVLALSACATSSTSLTPAQQEAIAITAATSARQAADQLLTTKKITADEAASIDKQADNIVSLVTTIRLLPASDATLPTNIAQLAALVQTLNQFVATVGNQK